MFIIQEDEYEKMGLNRGIAKVEVLKKAPRNVLVAGKCVRKVQIFIQ